MNKTIDGFSNYQIYDDGRIWSNKINRGKTTGWLIPTNSSPNPCKNYPCIRMVGDDGVRKSFKLHRLVALAFIPNPENKPEVNHIDNNKFNCSVDNLEWVTKSENRIHAVKYGNAFIPSRKGIKHTEETKRKVSEGLKKYHRLKKELKD